MAKRVRTGELRHRVTIQSRAETLDDDFGLATAAWQDVRTIAARVRSLSGRELELARQRVADASLIVTIRHVAGLTTKNRFTFGDRILHIGAVVDPEERGRWLDCYCSEEL